MKKKWTEEEVNALIRLWPTCKNTEDLRRTFPGRSPAALWLKAAQLGLRAYKRCRRGDLTPLLLDTPETWYWLGFMLADGHISPSGNFCFTLHERDEDHLKKLGKLINCRVKRPYSKGDSSRFVRLETMNKEVCDKLKFRLGLGDGPKTYNAPDEGVLGRLTSHQLKCLFVGFFDGDGTMRVKRYGQFGCHSSWAKVFRLFQEKGLVKSVRVAENRVYATVPKLVVQELETLDVPKMERKWHG